MRFVGTFSECYNNGGCEDWIDLMNRRYSPSFAKHLEVWRSFFCTISRGQNNLWLCEANPPTLLAAGRSQITATRTTRTSRAVRNNFNWGHMNSMDTLTPSCLTRRCFDPHAVLPEIVKVIHNWTEAALDLITRLLFRSRKD